MLGPSARLPPDYFQPQARSPETDELRTKIRVTLEEEIARYFKDNIGQVAIYDANVRSAAECTSGWPTCLRPPKARLTLMVQLTANVYVCRTERNKGSADSLAAEVRGARGQRLLHRSVSLSSSPTTAFEP